MKTIYLDAGFRCHVTDDGTMTAVETAAFDGKCDAYIEGYRFVPSGTLWTREDGTVFLGEMIAPWRDYDILAAYQEQYEAMLSQQEAAYQEGVNSL
ncbi:MAG: hypothetical protein ACI4PH_01265 [Faecousia sp.]